MSKVKIRRGDKVQVIAGKDKGKQGRVILVDREAGRVIVEGVNVVTKHKKPKANQQGGIIHQEAPIHVSNVMFLQGGKPTRIGYKVETSLKDGKEIKTKSRIAKSTGEVID